MTEEQAAPIPGLRKASQIPDPEPPSWVAPGWLPRKEITVLVGDEGIGKSVLWVLVVASVTTGRPFPAMRLPEREPSDVILIITEDSWGEVRARLEVAGADLDRIHLFSEDPDGTGAPVFPKHQDLLLKRVEALGITAALVVVDAWLDTVENSKRVKDTQQAREALAPWKTMAARLGAAVLLLTHTNRLETSNIRDLMGATAALRQKARMVLFAARQPGDGDDGGPHHLWVGPEKANTAGLQNALRFTLSIRQVRPQTADDPGTVATLTAPKDAGATIRELVQAWHDAKREADHDQKLSQAERAEPIIRAYMTGKEHDVVLSTEVQEHVQGHGIGQRSTLEAMQRIGRIVTQGYHQPRRYLLDALTPQSDPMHLQTAEFAETADIAELQADETRQSPQTPQAADTWQDRGVWAADIEHEFAEPTR